MQEKTRELTQEQAEAALAQVAAWLGRRGYGGPNGEPAPTGRDAAYRAEGPMLVMDWDWPSRPTPTVILEGGPYDWAIEAAWSIDVPGVFAEPYSGWALCLYPD